MTVKDLKIALVFGGWLCGLQSPQKLWGGGAQMQYSVQHVLKYDELALIRKLALISS